MPSYQYDNDNEPSGYYDRGDEPSYDRELYYDSRIQVNFT